MLTNTQLMVNALQRLQYEVEFGHHSLHSLGFHPTKGQVFHMLKRYWLHIKLLVQQTTTSCTAKILSLQVYLIVIFLAPVQVFISLSFSHSSPLR